MKGVLNMLFGANILCAISSKRTTLGFTDGCNILNTPIKKHFIDLLERLRSERYKDEVSCFNVGDVF